MPPSTQPHPDADLIALDPGRVDLWFTRTHPVEPALAARYHALLTPPERQQQQRFHFERDRQRCLLTRALVRDTLSHYAPVAPADWRFAPGAYGKPAIAEPAAWAQPIAFNLSHTDGLVLLVVSTGRALGVDVESTRRAAPTELAERYFAAAESRALRRLAEPLQPARFWALWTLKESYIKARGMGLSIPLDQFGFDLETPRGIRLDRSDALQDDAAPWQFVQLRPTPEHQAALCLEARGDDPALPRLTLRECVPLAGHMIVPCVVERSSAPADAA